MSGQRHHHHQHHRHHQPRDERPPVIQNRAYEHQSGMVRREISTAADEIEHTVVQNLRAIFTRPQREQIAFLIQSCRSIDLDLSSCPQEQIPLIYRNWIRRYHLFFSTTKEDRVLYLHNLRKQFEGRSNADASFRMATHSLPNYENFVRSIRTNMYQDALDGSWFSWWNRALRAMASANGISRNDQLRWDQDLIRHLMEYEIIRNVDANVGSVKLPPILSDSQGPQGSLPPVTQVMRGNISGNSGSPSYGSSSQSNAGSSR
ncbi:hypothetical protein F5B19DRAFT_500327 [Rostrohypoxylon terebratum]|nr:hypothetical protein F5B19DRAFT_500327 [Rostrohypoxylon terebratum]